MNPGCTPARIGLSHFPDKITDLTIGFWSSGTFGFEFPEKLKTLAVPVHNSIRPYYDKRFAPRNPNSGKQNPEGPIHHSNFRPLVCPFHYGQLVAKCKVLSAARFEEILVFDHMTKARFRNVFVMILDWQAYASLSVRPVLESF
jgi:hypothetical protein